MEVSSILAVIFLLRIIIPGFMTCFLFARLFFPAEWSSLSGVEQSAVSLFVGLVTYFTGLGYYTKVYFPWIKRGMAPLRTSVEALIKEKEIMTFQVNNKNLDAFHSMFWLGLDNTIRDDLRFYYSYYLFEAYISVILILYILARLAARGIPEPCELKWLLPLTAVATFLYWKASQSLRLYFIYFVSLVSKDSQRATSVIQALAERGPEQIPGPRPFA
jgi:hypothetical protein